MSTPIERIRDLLVTGECVVNVPVSPVFSLGTGWKIGRIVDHVAKPLNNSEAMLATECACKALNRRRDIALLVKLVDAVKAMREARKHDDDESGQPSIKFMGAFADAMDALAELEAQ